MTAVAINGSFCVGICSHPSHTVPVPKTGAVFCVRPKFIVYGSHLAQVGDTVYSSCGHTGKIMDGSPTIKHNNEIFAKVGSSFSGDFSGYIISGQPLCQVV